MIQIVDQPINSFDYDEFSGESIMVTKVLKMGKKKAITDNIAPFDAALLLNLIRRCKERYNSTRCKGCVEHCC